MKMILQLLKINGLKMVKNILIMELDHGGTAVMKICLKEKELMFIGHMIPKVSHTQELIIE